jgi:hypothetical protein
VRKAYFQHGVLALLDILNLSLISSAKTFAIIIVHLN